MGGIQEERQDTEGWGGRGRSAARRVAGVLGLALALALPGSCEPSDSDSEADGQGQPADSGSSPAPPERFVMASVANEPDGTLEVRVSPDGEQWSAPSYPLTLDCNTVIPVNTNIAPGLAATSTHYLVAAYGFNDLLYYSKSRDGVQWEPAIAATPVETGTTSLSRPSVVYDRDEGVWYALLVKASGNAHSVTFLDLDGMLTSGARALIDGFEASVSPSIAYTGLPGRRYVLGRTHRDGGGARPADLSFRFYESLPFDFSDVNFPRLQQEVQLRNEASPWVSGTLGQILLATSYNEVNGGLASGVNEIWSFDASAEEWQSVVKLSNASSDHEGATVAGVHSEMVVASPRRSGATDIWHVAEDRLGVLRAEHQKVRTRSFKPAALAFGPKRGSETLPRTCSPTPDQPLKTVVLRFRSFKRVIAPSLGNFDDAEDVTLTVSHRTVTGFVDREYDADPSTPGIQGKRVTKATKNQRHLFNEGEPGADLPAFEILMQPTETVKVCLSGDLGESCVDLDYAALSAPQGAGNDKNTHTVDATAQQVYQLSYDATVASAQ